MNDSNVPFSASCNVLYQCLHLEKTDAQIQLTKVGFVPNRKMNGCYLEAAFKIHPGNLWSVPQADFPQIA
jgi:hypothetical protein